MEKLETKVNSFLTRIKAVCLGSGWWNPRVFETDFQWYFSLYYNVLLDINRYRYMCVCYINLRYLHTTCTDSFSIATVTLKLQNTWVNFLTSEGKNKNSSESAYWCDRGG